MTDSLLTRLLDRLFRRDEARPQVPAEQRIIKPQMDTTTIASIRADRVAALKRLDAIFESSDPPPQNGRPVE